MSTRINSTNDDYYPVISRQASCSNRPLQGNLEAANEHCNRLQQPVNNLMKFNHFNKFGEYPSHMKRLSSTQTSSIKNTHSYRCASSSRLASSQNSPSSTDSSPILHTSSMSSSTQSSPILPSSTHSSPILQVSRTPSPTHGTSISLISHSTHISTSIHNGVEAPTASGLVNFDVKKLASVRDPVTNKIMIKPVNTHQKDKESVSTTSKSVIAQEPISNHFPRTAAAASAKCQSGDERQPLSSTSFSLPPLSVRGADHQNQENLPELLKPKNLVKYIEASAPKKKLVEKSSQSISVLLDHDYSRTVIEEKPVERRLKRTFIIPKKKAGNAAVVSERKNENEVLDNLEVVDMECSDTENDGSIILNGSGGLIDKNEKPSQNGKSVVMLYGCDEFSTESKFIDEEAELCYSNEHNNAAASCPMYQNILKEIESDLNDPSNWVEKTRDNRCLLGYTDTLGLRTGLWWQEIEELANSTSPDSERSVISHLSEEDEDEEIMTVSDAAAAINNFVNRADSDFLDILQEPGFYSVPSFAKHSDSSVDLDNLYLDQLDVEDEIVECSVSEVVVQTEEEIVAGVFVPQMEQSVVGSVVNGNRSVSPLTSLSQTSSEMSDSDSLSPDESKENMVNKVPAYLLNLGKLGTEKNVLQRLNVKQEPESPPGSCNRSWDESCNRSWDESCIKLALSPDREKNNRCSTSIVYENGSASTSEFSMSYCRTRSPSPDYTGRNYSSRLPRRDSYHRKTDRYRQRQRQWSRSRSRSPSYPQKQRYMSKQTTEEIDDEQRRVVYVGKLPNNFTEHQLKDLFRSHGDIEKVSLHFRSSKDNYGFVTFKDKGDATRCLEVTNQIHDFPFEVCYGGRREFCKEEYADLDGITEQIEEYGPATVRNEETSYEQLLKQYSRDRKH